ncbi:MAG: methylmalonyl Co-A mutase-associated GTPase MeaB [Gemmatimonadota bacterium]|nr:MAG: methylmalonyl Co-A mutase-associated GTPase MeaB [Gemmatimonadota bacterium]
MTELRPSERELLNAFQAGEARALARAISWVENARPGFERLLSALHDRVGRAQRIGITGPPGAGKSTLIHALAQVVRGNGEQVGVVAVDPTSPFTGGALLGDRIRMTSAAGDDGVFIRSMASRGSVGGLATTSREVADLMDAFGFERVFVETVGVGQSELEIAEAADTTVVVLTPESGDSIQAMKAGLMEIADIIVVNKADRPEAARAAGELKTILRIRQGKAFDRIPAHHGVDLSEITRRKLAPGSGGEPSSTAGEAAEASGAEAKEWEIPVLLTVAQEGEGIDGLLAVLDAHFEWLGRSGVLEERRRQRLLERVRAVVDRGLRTRVWREGDGEAILERARADLESGRRTPYDVAGEILGALGPGSGKG